MGVLAVDTNSDEVVNSADAFLARKVSGAALSETNFRQNVNLDGAINSADATIVRARSGTAVP